MKRTLTSSTVVVFGLLASVASSHAAAIWDGDTDNNWLTNTNWSGNSLPGVENTILEGDGGDSATTLTGGSETVAGFQIRGGHVLTIDNAGFTLQVNGNINMGSAGTGTVNQIDGTVDVGDKLNLTGADSSFYTISGGALITSGLDVGPTAASTFAIVGDSATVTASAGAVDAGEFSTFSFSLGATGIDSIDTTGVMTIVSGAELLIDGSSYTGGAGTISLFSYASLADDTEFIETITGFGSLTADIVYTDTGIDLVLVPEPSTFALFGGLFVFASVVLRRRR
jgi:hypothetical protein